MSQSAMSIANVMRREFPPLPGPEQKAYIATITSANVGCKSIRLVFGSYFRVFGELLRDFISTRVDKSPPECH
jgi:hypothetical protein